MFFLVAIYFRYKFLIPFGIIWSNNRNCTDIVPHRHVFGGFVLFTADEEHQTSKATHTIQSYHSQLRFGADFEFGFTFIGQNFR